ncbi:MAG: hypothetical protein U9P07_08935 [Pseudomonadota bacterium]|nr:hypothetical protein [Pseudomonadota bacterium]
MALAHSRRPSMAGFRGVRRESHRVIRSAANTAMSQARTSGNYVPDNTSQKVEYSTKPSVSDGNQ